MKKLRVVVGVLAVMVLATPVLAQDSEAGLEAQVGYSLMGPEVDVSYYLTPKFNAGVGYWAPIATTFYDLNLYTLYGRYMFKGSQRSFYAKFGMLGVSLTENLAGGSPPISQNTILLGGGYHQVMGNGLSFDISVDLPLPIFAARVGYMF